MLVVHRVPSGRSYRAVGCQNWPERDNSKPLPLKHSSLCLMLWSSGLIWVWVLPLAVVTSSRISALTLLAVAVRCVRAVVVLGLFTLCYICFVLHLAVLVRHRCPVLHPADRAQSSQPSAAHPSRHPAPHPLYRSHRAILPEDLPTVRRCRAIAPDSPRFVVISPVPVVAVLLPEDLAVLLATTISRQPSRRATPRRCHRAARRRPHPSLASPCVRLPSSILRRAAVLPCRSFASPSAVRLDG